MIRAENIMQTRLVTVGADDPLLSVHRLFCDEEIGGAPVLGATGKVLGVVTLRDLVREARDREECPDLDFIFYREGLVASPAAALQTGPEQMDHLTSRTAADVMSEGIISVAPDATIPEVVEQVVVNHVHRILVIDPTESSGALVGIISLFDLVQLLA